MSPRYDARLTIGPVIDHTPARALVGPAAVGAFALYAGFDLQATHICAAAALGTILATDAEADPAERARADLEHLEAREREIASWAPRAR